MPISNLTPPRKLYIHVYVKQIECNMYILFLGTLGLGVLSMQANAEIVHTKEIKLETSDIMMRYSSLIRADSINISSGTLHMEGEARLDTTARGNTQSVINPGVDPAGNGLGAGHGGFGGGADLINYTSGNILHWKVIF